MVALMILNLKYIATLIAFALCRCPVRCSGPGLRNGNGLYQMISSPSLCAHKLAFLDNKQGGKSSSSLLPLASSAVRHASRHANPPFSLCLLATLLLEAVLPPSCSRFSAVSILRRYTNV